MRYEVNEHETDVEIQVSDAAGRISRVLQSMRECQAGQCGCPTNQYDRLAGMDVHAGGDEVTVLLRPLPDQRLDVEQLRVCLDYTIATVDG
jgi:hypothetical protein